MPITFSESTRVGVGLWNVPVLGVSIEILLFAIGVCSYIRCTKAKNRKGSIGFWALVAFLATIYMASLLGPPPPSATVVAWSAQALWLLVAWGFWVDHHRLRSDGG
jgi:hypothetical protein